MVFRPGLRRTYHQKNWAWWRWKTNFVPGPSSRAEPIFDLHWHLNCNLPVWVEERHRRGAEAFHALRYQCLSPANFTSLGAPYFSFWTSWSSPGATTQTHQSLQRNPSKGHQVQFDTRQTFSSAIILLNAFRSVSTHVHHAYIVTFASVQHKDYYLDHDPAHCGHNAFKCYSDHWKEKVVANFIEV